MFTHDQINSSLEIAFKFAVDQINRDAHLLPHTQVSYDIQYVPHDDSFYTIKTGMEIYDIETIILLSFTYIIISIKSM